MPSVREAASGGRAALLRALRDTIAEAIDGGVQDRDLASLSLRLLDISKELEGLEGDGTGAVAGAASTDDEPWDG